MGLTYLYFLLKSASIPLDKKEKEFEKYFTGLKIGGIHFIKDLKKQLEQENLVLMEKKWLLAKFVKKKQAILMAFVIPVKTF